MVGVSQRTAPAALRESFVIGPSQLPAALARLPGGAGVILSTCNRTEIYAVNGDPSVLQSRFFPGVEPHYLEQRTGLAAVEHLFRVAAGQESQVVGETQIIGQVRQAYGQAVAAGTVTKELHLLFQRALQVGKGAERRGGSIAQRAVAEASRILGPLKGQRALVIGAGQVAKELLFHLQQAAAEVVVANRTPRPLGVEVVGLREVPSLVAEVAVTFAATGAPGYVLTEVAGPALLFDLALPRDIDPQLANRPGVALIGLDELGRGHGLTSLTPQTLTFARDLAARRAVPEILRLSPELTPAERHLEILRLKAQYTEDPVLLT